MNGFIWLGAGLLIIAGIWLSRIGNERWLALSLLGAGYLLASGITGYCPIQRFLARKAAKKNQSHDIDHK